MSSTHKALPPQQQQRSRLAHFIMQWRLTRGNFRPRAARQGLAPRLGMTEATVEKATQHPDAENEQHEVG